MTNLLKFPNMRRFREEAALWIVRIERELSEQELQTLKQWLADSPRHREAFIEAARLWDGMDVLNKLSKVFPLEDYAPAPRQVHWKQLSGLAAGLAVVAFALLRPDSTVVQQPAAPPVAQRVPDAIPTARTYETIIGQQSLVSLADGTKIRLNTNSLVGVSYSRDSRHVHLVRGEAHFEVAKDAARPFDVQAGSHVIRAVGTAFTVRMSGTANLEVTVTEGRIRVMDEKSRKAFNSGSADVSLTALPTAVAGQLVTVADSGKARVRDLDRVEVSDRTAWQSGTLVFRGAPLRDVLKEFSRYTNRQFIANDDSIGDIPVGGIFQAADVESLLTSLRVNFGLQTWPVGDAIVIANRADADGHLGPSRDILHP